MIWLYWVRSCIENSDECLRSHQNLVGNKTFFPLWYVCFDACKKKDLKRKLHIASYWFTVQSFFWVCWPEFLYTKHQRDWITCFDRDGREIAASTEERSSNMKKKKNRLYSKDTSENLKPHVPFCQIWPIKVELSLCFVVHYSAILHRNE